MTNSLTPCAEYTFMMCHRIGLPPISIIGFGLRPDSSLMRVPMPPARITHFIDLFVAHQVRVFSQKIAADPVDSPVGVMTGAHKRFESPLQLLVRLRVNDPTLCALKHLKHKISHLLGGVFKQPDAAFPIQVCEPEVRHVRIEGLAKLQI